MNGTGFRPFCGACPIPGPGPLRFRTSPPGSRWCTKCGRYLYPLAGNNRTPLDERDRPGEPEEVAG
jgi:hypothetical protein